MADLFVSYSRKDKEFVRHLVDGLVEREKEVWVDWEDIAPTAEWMSEIELGIDASDSFAFVISPDSLTSGTCARELERARTQGKRIVPLLHREPNGAGVPAELATRNWIYFRSSDDFDQSLATCVEALETNLDWVRFHTRLIVRAQEWAAGGRDRSRLLSGADLRAAESELATAGPELEPQPTPLQREYVLASRRAHSRRQRVVLAAVSVALVLTLVLALLAWVQRDRAISNERTASSRELATAATGVIERDPELSVLLAREALGRKRTDEAEEALRRALSLSHAISTTERHGWITTASFDANGERILASSRDGTSFIAASDDGRTETTLTGHSRPVASAAFSPDERLVVTASTDGTARVWDAETGAERTVLTGHGDRVSQATFSGDGRFIATGSKDGTARIWDAATGRQLFVLRHPDWVSRVAFTPDGRTLVTGCDDGSARIWDARTGQLRHVLPGGGGAVLALAVDSRGRLAASGTDGGAVRLWDVQTGRLRHALGGHTGVVAAVAFSPSGSVLASGGQDAVARLWSTATGARVLELSGHTDIVTAIAFSPDGGSVATASGDGIARLWDTEGRLLLDFRGHGAWLTSVSFSRDGRRLLTSGGDGTARVWDVTVGTPVRLLPGGFGIAEATFSPDGSRVAADGLPGTIWETVTGGRKAELMPGGSQVAFAADGTRVAVGARNGDVGVYDAGSGREVALLHGHTGATRDIAFSPDGSRLVTGSDDGTARIWRASGGPPVAVLDAHQADVRAAAFSPDGELVVTAGEDGTARPLDSGRRSGRDAPARRPGAGGGLQSAGGCARDRWERPGRASLDSDRQVHHRPPRPLAADSRACVQRRRQHPRERILRLLRPRLGRARTPARDRAATSRGGLGRRRLRRRTVRGHRQLGSRRAHLGVRDGPARDPVQGQPDPDLVCRPELRRPGDRRGRHPHACGTLVPLRSLRLGRRPPPRCEPAGAP